jgi:hypothetical protein
VGTRGRALSSAAALAYHHGSALLVSQQLWRPIQIFSASRFVDDAVPTILATAQAPPKPHATWHLDEVYLKIDGPMAYL